MRQKETVCLGGGGGGYENKLNASVFKPNSKYYIFIFIINYNFIVISYYYCITNYCISIRLSSNTNGIVILSLA